MASLVSHPAIALSLIPWFQRKKLPPSVWQLGAICTMLPDADVIAFRFGIPYEAMFGHRGFTHSFFFAALVSTLIIFVTRLRAQGTPSRDLFLYFFLCTASHGVLDAMTSGGLGVAFFAPFSSERYFLPWRPIRVSPISIRGFLSARGLTVLQSELLWVWAPTFAFALVGYCCHIAFRKHERV